MAHKTQLRTKEPESEYSKSTNDQATATNTNPGPMESPTRRTSKETIQVGSQCMMTDANKLYKQRINMRKEMQQQTKRK